MNLTLTKEYAESDYYVVLFASDIDTADANTACVVNFENEVDAWQTFEIAQKIIDGVIGTEIIAGVSQALGVGSVICGGRVYYFTDESAADTARIFLDRINEILNDAG